MSEGFTEIGVLTIGDGSDRWKGLPAYRVTVLGDKWIELAPIVEDAGQIQRHATMHSLLFGLLQLIGVNGPMRGIGANAKQIIGTLRADGVDYTLSIARREWLTIEKEPGLRIGSFSVFECVLAALLPLAAKTPAPWPVLRSTLRNLETEVARSRTVYPANTDLLAALTCESGELAEALLRSKEWSFDPMSVYAEALQVAAVALRIAEEGDPQFPSYRHTEEIAEDYSQEDSRE